MTVTRRRFAIAAAAATAAAACGPLSTPQANDELQRRLAKLSYNTASGGGVNLKLMPDPTTGKPTVPLAEIFSFDRYHAICRVETNPLAFKMPTHAMGEVLIAPNAFFMAMTATTIDQFKISHDPDGKLRLLMRGGLGCSTEVAQGSVRIGSRTAAEHATFEIEAVDAGLGPAQAEDRFAYTAFFDEQEAPVNFAIFGPKATFTGTLIEGKVTIVDPATT